MRYSCVWLLLLLLSFSGCATPMVAEKAAVVEPGAVELKVEEGAAKVEEGAVDVEALVEAKLEAALEAHFSVWQTRFEKLFEEINLSTTTSEDITAEDSEVAQSKASPVTHINVNVLSNGMAVVIGGIAVLVIAYFVYLLVKNRKLNRLADAETEVIQHAQIDEGARNVLKQGVKMALANKPGVSALLDEKLRDKGWLGSG